MIMDAEPVMQVSRFHPIDMWHDLDRHLRDLVPTALAVQPGLIEAWAGRSGPDTGDERVVVSVWASASAQQQAPTLTTLFDRMTSTAGAIVGERTDVLTIAIEARFERSRPMTLLRVYQGQTRPGELASYLEEARAGVIKDGQQPRGPGALICGSRGDLGFVTASLWPDWESIQLATGGDIRNPLATRNTARLAAGRPNHFELIATVSGGSGTASATPVQVRRGDAT